MAIRIEPTAKWIRGMLDGSMVVDSRAVQLVWEIRYYPQYYVPSTDIADGLLAPVDEHPSVVLGGQTPLPPWGTPTVWQVGGGTGRALTWPDHDELGSHVRFRWDALDHWFEEDQEVHVHPRNPYSRIDILPSSRHVQVEVDDTIVADTHRPVMLFETGLPARTYIPKTDVRMDLLTPTDTETACPYKGFAEYWSLEVDGTVHEDIVWSYRTPLPESAAIAGLVAFYDEQVDVIVDGERVARPRSPFS